MVSLGLPGRIVALIISAMVRDIRKHLGVTPFVPFRIRMADGHEYPVPTVDHIYLPPCSTRVIAADDEGMVAVLPALLISGFVQSDNGSPQNLRALRSLLKYPCA
jgi:hypothetical protein